MEKRYLTPKETSEMLGVNVFTIYAWALRNEIPSYKLGRLRRFDRIEIEKWVQQHAKGKRSWN